MIPTMNRYTVILFVIGVLLLQSCNGSSPSGKASTGSRPTGWATPIHGLPGLPNFYKVDDGLYRGAQPEEEGFAQLKKLGIKTVVNLRSLHSDRSECEKHGLDYVKITAQAWEAEEEEVVDFLKIATDPDRKPVFVHCQHGADRTGLMVASYRIVEMGWTKEEAIREMKDGGFGYHTIWKGLLTYIRELDVSALKAKIQQE